MTVAALVVAIAGCLFILFIGARFLLAPRVAMAGFSGIAAALEAVEPEPMARMRAYLDFAMGQPHVYEAMFSMPSGLPFGTGSSPEPLRRAFAAIRDAFPGPDDTRAEVAWAALHGLATLQISGRLPASRAQARLEHVHQRLTGD